MWWWHLAARMNNEVRSNLNDLKLLIDDGLYLTLLFSVVLNVGVVASDIFGLKLPLYIDGKASACVSLTYVSQ